MYCTKCGAQIPDDSMFCTSCGARVGGAEDQAEPVAFPVGMRRWATLQDGTLFRMSRLL